MRKACSLVDRANRAIQFILGDFMLHSEKIYGENAYQIFDHEDWRRLRNWRWVCSHIPQNERYNEEWVTYAHYREVVPLAPERRRYYLGRVVNEMLSARDLKALIRADQIAEIVAKVKADDKEFWLAYAEQTQCSVDALKEAIQNGRGWAEEQLDATKVPSFEDWYRAIQNNPAFTDMSEEEKLRKAWYAACAGE